MKSNIYYPGAEIEGVIIEFHSPNEFYCSFIDENEYIKISEFNVNDSTYAPDKSEVVQQKKFSIRVGDENVLCEVLNNLKLDEVTCQVLLCNTSAKLKVNYQSLRHLNEFINNENIIPLKVHAFAPHFQTGWDLELIEIMKEKLLYNRFIIQFRSNMPDPADGRYPVILLNPADRKSITDPYIKDKLAIPYSDYHSLWLDYEINRIFDCKETVGKQYAISTPMFKTRGSQTTKTSSPQKHKFNVEAQPFTPTLSKTNLAKLNTESPSPFTYENLPGFSNGTIFSNFNSTSSVSNEAPTLTEKLTLVPRITKPFLFKPNDLNVGQSFPFVESKRAKKGLEIVSPSSVRKDIGGNLFTNTFTLSVEPQLADEKLQSSLAYSPSAPIKPAERPFAASSPMISQTQSVAASSPMLSQSFVAPSPNLAYHQAFAKAMFGNPDSSNANSDRATTGIVPYKQYPFFNPLQSFVIPQSPQTLPFLFQHMSPSHSFNNVSMNMQAAITPANVSMGQALLSKQSH